MVDPICWRDMADDTESGEDERIGSNAEAVSGAAVAAAARGGGAGPHVGDPVVSGSPRWSSEATALAVRACQVIQMHLTHAFFDVPLDDAVTGQGIFHELLPAITLEAILQRHGALLRRRGERVVSDEAALSSPRDTTAE